MSKKLAPPHDIPGTSPPSVAATSSHHTPSRRESEGGGSSHHKLQLPRRQSDHSSQLNRHIGSGSTPNMQPHRGSQGHTSSANGAPAAGSFITPPTTHPSQVATAGNEASVRLRDDQRQQRRSAGAPSTSADGNRPRRSSHNSFQDPHATPVRQDVPRLRNMVPSHAANGTTASNTPPSPIYPASPSSATPLKQHSDARPQDPRRDLHNRGGGAPVRKDASSPTADLSASALFQPRASSRRGKEGGPRGGGTTTTQLFNCVSPETTVIGDVAGSHISGGRSLASRQQRPSVTAPRRRDTPSLPSSCSHSDDDYDSESESYHSSDEIDNAVPQRQQRAAHSALHHPTQPLSEQKRDLPGGERNKSPKVPVRTTPMQAGNPKLIGKGYDAPQRFVSDSSGSYTDSVSSSSKRPQPTQSVAAQQCPAATNPIRRNHRIQGAPYAGTPSRSSSGYDGSEASHSLDRVDSASDDASSSFTSSSYTATSSSSEEAEIDGPINPASPLFTREFYGDLAAKMIAAVGGSSKCILVNAPNKASSRASATAASQASPPPPRYSVTTAASDARKTARAHAASSLIPSTQKQSKLSHNQQRAGATVNSGAARPKPVAAPAPPKVVAVSLTPPPPPKVPMYPPLQSGSYIGTSLWRTVQHVALSCMTLLDHNNSAPRKDSSKKPTAANVRSLNALLASPLSDLVNSSDGLDTLNTLYMALLSDGSEQSSDAGRRRHSEHFDDVSNVDDSDISSSANSDASIVGSLFKQLPPQFQQAITSRLSLEMHRRAEVEGSAEGDAAGVAALGPPTSRVGVPVGINDNNNTSSDESTRMPPTESLHMSPPPSPGHRTERGVANSVITNNAPTTITIWCSSSAQADSNKPGDDNDVAGQKKASNSKTSQATKLKHHNIVVAPSITIVQRSQPLSSGVAAKPPTSHHHHNQKHQQLRKKAAPKAIGEIGGIGSIMDAVATALETALCPSNPSRCPSGNHKMTSTPEGINESLPPLIAGLAMAESPTYWLPLLLSIQRLFTRNAGSARQRAAAPANARPAANRPSMLLVFLHRELFLKSHAAKTGAIPTVTSHQVNSQQHSSSNISTDPAPYVSHDPSSSSSHHLQLSRNKNPSLSSATYELMEPSGLKQGVRRG